METFKNIYLHLPFCETKCHYCDFFSLPEGKITSNQRESIYESILSEIDFYKLSESVSSVFIGGGTPSLAPLETMDCILSKLKINSSSDLVCEVTMEANPSSITYEKAKAWKEMGINRISMGVQSLNDERLNWLGRVHSRVEAVDALTTLFEAGFKRISIDYILGVPNQTIKDIDSELEFILNEFPDIEHLSAYLLTLNSGNSKYEFLPKDSDQIEHLLFTKCKLESLGFEHYEVSNFAKCGAKSLHNENYWLGGGYIGIGPSAHSYEKLSGLRSRTTSNLEKYALSIREGKRPLDWEEYLSVEQLRLEYIMLRIRRADGLDLLEYEKLFNRNIYSDNERFIQKSIHDGICTIGDGNKLKLRGRGFFLSDEFINKII